MSTIIYILGALMTLACAGLLGRSYLKSRHLLLFWSALSFAGLALGNVILVLDKTVFLDSADLLNLRLMTTLAALLCLLYGLIWGEK